MTTSYLSARSKAHESGLPEQSPTTSPTEEFMLLGRAMLDALERVGYGAILVDRDELILSINDTARNLLQMKLGSSSGKVNVGWLQNAARRLPDRATPWFPSDAEAWRTLPCDGERPLALHRIPLSSSGSANHFIIILADLDGVPQPNPETLRRIFGLTGAETKLAIRIARGETPTEIARDHRLSVATIRCQLASIFAKTQTRRQTELAMLLARVAILP